MYKSIIVAATVALSFSLVIGLGDTAFAQKAKKAKASPKPLTYEQAAKKCLPFAQQLSADHHNARAARGTACMLHHGHRI